MDRNSGLTYDFLHRISKRLSGDPKWRKVEYEIHIHNGWIEMDPTIIVYKDCHHRKSTDRLNVIDVVLDSMLSRLSFSTEDLVDGDYIYRCYGEHQIRRWTNKII